jgi:hypothetical protein
VVFSPANSPGVAAARRPWAHCSPCLPRAVTPTQGTLTSHAPRKAELGRAHPILIPRGGHKQCGSYQLNAGNRCADRPFPRSRPTVGIKGMRSIGPLVCVLILWVGVHWYRAYHHAGSASRPRPAPPLAHAVCPAGWHIGTSIHAMPKHARTLPCLWRRRRWVRCPVRGGAGPPAHVRSRCGGRGRCRGSRRGWQRRG